MKPISGTNRERTGIALLALISCNAFWGLSFPLMTTINHLLDRHSLPAAALGALPEEGVRALIQSLLYLLLRFVAALVLLGLLRPGLVRETTGRQWLLGVSTGILFCAGITLQIVGLRDIPASRSAFLTSLSVVFTPLLMVFVERRLPKLWVSVGGIVALFGTAILTGVVDVEHFRWQGGNQLRRGDVLTTIGSVIFALLILQIDRISRVMPAARISPGMFAGIALSAASLSCGMLAFGGIEKGPWIGLAGDLPLIGLTIFMSLICTLIPFHLMNAYQHFFSPSHASLIYTLEPIFATFWALFIPGLVSPLFSIDYGSETLGMAGAFGGGMIIVGNILALIPSPSPTRTSPICVPE